MPMRCRSTVYEGDAFSLGYAASLLLQWAILLLLLAPGAVRPCFSRTSIVLDVLGPVAYRVTTELSGFARAQKAKSWVLVHS